MTELQLSMTEENATDSRRYSASITESPEHQSPHLIGRSRHLQKYNDELYRSLVQESPPQSLLQGTPASEERHTKTSRSTPLSNHMVGSPAKTVVPDEGHAQQHDTPHQGEYRTARDWDKIMTRKRQLAQEENHEPERDGYDEPQQTATSKAERAALPSYMRVTASFESRTNRERLEHCTHANHQPKPMTVPRVVSNPRRPTFRSTTKINAMEEIREELGEGERYVSMAERINMYLRGLGNSGNSSSDFVPNSTRSTAKRNISKNLQHRPIQASSKTATSSNSSDVSSSQQSRISASNSAHSERRIRDTQSREAGQKSNQDASRSRTDRIHIRTYQSTRHDRTGASSQRSTHTAKSYTRHEHPDSQESSQKETSEPVTKRQKTGHTRLQVQPFRFATDERARHHQKAFQAKLALWKEKEAAAQDEMKLSLANTRRGLKRKADRL